MSNPLQTPTGTGQESRGLVDAPRVRRASQVAMLVMAVLLGVAILFAASRNQVVGWVVAGLAAAWLVFFIIIAITVARAARKASAAMDKVTAQFAGLNNDGGAPFAVAQADPMRDEKLSHSFKILQVQGRVISEELAKGPEGDEGMVTRALETIEMTAHNGMSMLKKPAPSETVEGEVVED